MPEEVDARACRPPEFSDPHREPVNRQAWVRIGGTWRRALVSRWWRTRVGLVVHLIYEDGEMQSAGYFVYDSSSIQPGNWQLLHRCQEHQERLCRVARIMCNTSTAERAADRSSIIQRSELPLDERQRFGIQGVDDLPVRGGLPGQSRSPDDPGPPEGHGRVTDVIPS